VKECERERRSGRIFRERERKGEREKACVCVFVKEHTEERENEELYLRQRTFLNSNSR
jgi:hypothetical protein